MLHGWAQNVYVFSNRSKKLTKRLNQVGYKVIFLQAPYQLPPKKPPNSPKKENSDDDCDNLHNNNDNTGILQEYDDTAGCFSREYAYAWFVYTEDDPTADTTPCPSTTGNYPGMKESLYYLRTEIQRIRNDEENIIKKNELIASTDATTTTTTRPSIYLLGFSQGAVLVHKVVTLACATTNKSNSGGSDDMYHWRNMIQKCILVSGFSFYSDIVNGRTSSDDSSNKQDDVPARISIPSLHVIGINDKRVPPKLTRQVYQYEACFHDRCVIWEHKRGHVLPQDRPFCNAVIEFLENS
jgi:predicted esterase